MGKLGGRFTFCPPSLVPVLVSMIMISVGAMYRVGIMVTAMVNDVAFMVMGVGVGVSTLVRMRMRRAVCMSVLVLVLVSAFVIVGFHGASPFVTPSTTQLDNAIDCEKIPPVAWKCYAIDLCNILM